MQNKKVPMRTCVACRECKEKKELIRVVRTLEGNIETDLTGKKNGRGAYVCGKKECFEKLKKTHGLDRAFGEKVSDEVYDSVIKEIFGEE